MCAARSPIFHEQGAVQVQPETVVGRDAKNVACGDFRHQRPGPAGGEIVDGKSFRRPPPGPAEVHRFIVPDQCRRSLEILVGIIFAPEAGADGGSLPVPQAPGRDSFKLLHALRNFATPGIEHLCPGSHLVPDSLKNGDGMRRRAIVIAQQHITVVGIRSYHRDR